MQRVIEEAGIPTVSITLAREVSERLAPPRALFVRWPLGHPLGEPGNVLQQRRMLWECFRDLRHRPAAERGQVKALNLRWRRERYSAVDFAALDEGVAVPGLGGDAEREKGR